MSSYGPGNRYMPTVPSSRRVTDKSSTAVSSPLLINNSRSIMNNKFSTCPSGSLLHRSPYSSNLMKNGLPSSYTHQDGLFKCRTRDGIKDGYQSRDVPIKPTYRPESFMIQTNNYRWNPETNYRANKNIADNDDNNISTDLFSKLNISSPKNLKKSSSHQDMLTSSSLPGRHIPASTNTTHASNAANDYKSTGTFVNRLHTQQQQQPQRRASITRTHNNSLSTSSSSRYNNMISNGGGNNKPDNSVFSIVDKFNKRNLQQQQTQQQQPHNSRLKSKYKCTTANVAADDSDQSSSSMCLDPSPPNSNTSSPNNNTNNFTKKYINKGKTGLQNIGNTCFMNCVLQCLANTYPLLQLCLNFDLNNQINTETSRMRGSLVRAYVDLTHSMWRGLDSFSPTTFKQEVSRFAKLFAGYNQQDAQEFLMYLLQGLHEDLNRIKTKKKGNNKAVDDSLSSSEKALQSWKHHLNVENSYIVDLFEGQLKSALTCRLCGHVSNTFDPFLGLSLPIKKVSSYGETTLIACFELFTQEELLDGNEKTTCEKCKKKQPSTKRLTIQRFPRILIINLKRFSEESFYRSKLTTQVNCPIKKLDLRKFSDQDVEDEAIYNLYGVCNHSGTPMGGHYTAFARNPFSNEWHLFNDQRVSSVSENSLISSDAYILFYEQITK